MDANNKRRSLRNSTKVKTVNTVAVGSSDRKNYPGNFKLRLKERLAPSNGFNLERLGCL
ncbi:hypothetical protein QUA35_17910 [Microcoleus sp. N9_B2]|uniref:hypothetical protein n=1 Tax=unclassified Microcoleus TaxID=2642155 RepID=UPI002FCF6879